MYCIKCDTFGSYTKHYRQVDFTVNFLPFDYEEEFAVCDNCGEEVYVDSVNDRNCEEREKVYHKFERYTFN